jgi:hypothetical protein
VTSPAFPDRGSFAWHTLLGAHRPDPASMLDPRPIFGLDPEMTFLYGCLRTETGDMYEAVRSIRAVDREGPEFASALSGFVLQTTAGHDDPCMHVMPISAQAATSKYSTHRLVDGCAIWSSNEIGEGRPWEITFSGPACTWREDRILDLTGRLIPPGLHWYMPDRDLGMYYVSQLYEVSGTILGEPVRGMIGFDQNYMPDGGILYRRRDTLVGQQVHSLWYTWGTRYKDGSLDAGHFQVGHGRSGFALMTNERGEPFYTNKVSAEIVTRKDHEGQEWPARIVLDVDGTAWEFLPDPRGTMPDLLKFIQSSTPQNEGRWRRVGDTREPDVWFAWGEIAPEHGLVHQPRFRS